MSTDRGNDELLQRYRAASAAVDERPSASARASILAAAARQAGAKPTDAGLPYRRARWPLAAAAAVMLSTLAVMLAIRTQDEMPSFQAPSDTSNTTRVPAAPPVSEPAQQESKTAEHAPPPQSRPGPEQPARSRADGGARPVDQLEEQKRSAPSKLADADLRGRANGVDATENRAKEGARTQADTAAAANAPRSMPPMSTAESAPSTPPAASPAPIAKQRMERDANVAPQAFGQSGAESKAADAKPSEVSPMSPPPPAAAAAERPAEARRDSTQPIAGATAPAPVPQSARSETAESAAAWLERIIKLRRDGRHADADAELKLFRERYPQVQVPAAALPATGTR